MKSIIIKLINPVLFMSIERPSNFLSEISDSKTHYRCDKEYMKSFSKARITEYKILRNSDIFFDILSTIYILFCAGLIYLANGLSIYNQLK